MKIILDNKKSELILEEKKISRAEEAHYNHRELTFILYDVDVIKEISKICLPKARQSEFQVGYEGLHIEFKKYNKIVNIMIPISYYNFKQEVTSVSVDYELNDVTDNYNKIKGLHDITNLEKILNSLLSFEKLGYEIKYSIGDFGSIHRHPSLSEFSGIDLRNDPENPGVIFRKSDFKGLQTDSIIYIPNDEYSSTRVFYSEARRFDIRSNENGVEGSYQQHKCHNIYFSKNGFIDEISFDDLLNFKDEIVSDDTFYYLDDEKMDNSLINIIIKSYKEIDFSPSIEGIDPDNITKKTNVYIKDEFTSKTLDSIYPTIYDYNMEDFLDCENVVYDNSDKNNILVNFMVFDEKTGIIKKDFDDYALNIGNEFYPVYKYKDKIFDESNQFSNVINGEFYMISDC